MVDKNTQENPTQTTETASDSGAETGSAPKDSRVATFILMGVVIVMAVSTMGLIVINATSPTNAQESEATEASADPASENPVVARIDGREFRAEDLRDFMASMPPQLQQIPMQFVFPSLVNQFANLELATEEAYRQGLDSDDEVLEILKQREAEVVRDVLLERIVDERVTDDAIDDAYNEFLLSNAAETEVQARHILVETLEEAEAAIVALDGGADFAELATELSTGPSSVNGGDLGYFTRDRMVPPFAEAAFNLEPGTYTDTPVETQFGFHVILVEDRRETQQPTKEELRPQLRDQIANQVVQSYFDELREGRTIELFDLQGEPLDEDALIGTVNQ